MERRCLPSLEDDVVPDAGVALPQLEVDAASAYALHLGRGRPAVLSIEEDARPRGLGRDAQGCEVALEMDRVEFVGPDIGGLHRTPDRHIAGLPELDLV